MENNCLPKFPKFSEIILAAAFTCMNLMYFQIYTFANPRSVILASKDGLENRNSKMEQLLGSYKSFLLFFFYFSNKSSKYIHYVSDNTEKESSLSYLANIST